MNCNYEVGNSSMTGKAPGWWWYRIVLNRFEIKPDRYNYRTKESAIKAAKRAAKLFGLTVVKAYESGQET